jgi:hypothetical protein
MDTNNKPEESLPEIGTPEYDEYMVKVHRETHGVSDEAENEEKADKADSEEKTELPEGLTLEQLIEFYNTHKQADSEEATEETESEPEAEQEPENDELKALREKIKEMEDEAVRQAILAEAGGEDSYKALQEFATENFNEVQLEMFNAAIVNGTKEQAVAAVSLLKQLASVHGVAVSDKGFMSGKPNQPSGTIGFKSRAEFHAAISNPLYRDFTAKGDAYREEVQKRLALSRFE